MNIRLVGSCLFTNLGSTCKCHFITEFILALPKHCFIQVVNNVDSEYTTVLVYSYDLEFDFDEWYSSVEI